MSALPRIQFLERRPELQSTNRVHSQPLFFCGVCLLLCVRVYPCATCLCHLENVIINIVAIQVTIAMAQSNDTRHTKGNYGSGLWSTLYSLHSMLIPT